MISHNSQNSKFKIIPYEKFCISAFIWITEPYDLVHKLKNFNRLVQSKQYHRNFFGKVNDLIYRLKKKKNQGELIEKQYAERPVVRLQILCWETPRKCHLAASLPSFWCSSGNLSRVIVTCDPSCVLLAKCLQKERKDVADTQNSQLKRRLIIGSFSIDDGDGIENVTLKRYSRFFKRCRVYSNPLKMSNVGEFP